MIITRTPLRISLVGGGTDLPAFYKKSPGAVLSFAINKYVYVVVNDKFDNRFRIAYSSLETVDTIKEIKHNIIREALLLSKCNKGLEITTIADIPGSGSGLGSSSSLAVGVLKSMDQELDRGTLAEKAFVVEAEMCASPVGKQDQYAASFGGINFITFGKTNVNVRPIIPSRDWQCDFLNSSLLLWTGITRSANPILETQRKKYDNGTAIADGKQLAKLAHDFYDELTARGRFKVLGEIMDTAWGLKKKLSDGITNPEIDAAYSKAIKAGAYGGKILGAGGGGFLFFIAPQYMHKNIVEATGFSKIDFDIDHEGSKVIYEQ